MSDSDRPLRAFLRWLRQAPAGTLLNAGHVHDKLLEAANQYEPDPSATENAR
ncbi:hypothetical protein BH11GEM2_BH11GEM2_06710 [soil metagenome]